MYVIVTDCVHVFTLQNLIVHVNKADRRMKRTIIHRGNDMTKYLVLYKNYIIILDKLHSLLLLL